ncbi:MAG: branched-chain amino acid ABC transporter permease [Oscillospiraceae bacterium]|jgi:branched-chain amino acid transport system permease protein|nr:branched-chain amino acid ABC transporter permease [Oscillospiraceae bacterium]
MIKISKTTRTNALTYLLVIAAFAAVQVMMGTGMITASLKGQLVPICAYVVMAISLNLTVGILGELSLGHAGFMSVGAFAGVIAAASLERSVAIPELRLAIAIVVGAICAAAAGVLIGIPVLRLKGDYLAIVTLAFGEIISNVINCLYVGIDSKGIHINMLSGVEALHLEQTGRIIINGPVGAAGITKISSFTAGFILILITLLIVQNLINSRTGRAILAVRDNRISAESVGIGVTKYKMIAFVISAALAGIAGVLFALNINTIVPTKFNFNTSILILVFVVLGGLGNMWGSIIAATVLTILPEALRGFNNYRMLVYAIVLILIMLLTNSNAVKRLISRIRGGSRLKGGTQ